MLRKPVETGRDRRISAFVLLASAFSICQPLERQAIGQDRVSVMSIHKLQSGCNLPGVANQWEKAKRATRGDYQLAMLRSSLR